MSPMCSKDHRIVEDWAGRLGVQGYQVQGSGNLNPPISTPSVYSEDFSFSAWAIFGFFVSNTKLFFCPCALAPSFQGFGSGFFLSSAGNCC